MRMSSNCWYGLKHFDKPILRNWDVIKRERSLKEVPYQGWQPVDAGCVNRIFHWHNTNRYPRTFHIKVEEVMAIFISHYTNRNGALGFNTTLEGNYDPLFFWLILYYPSKQASRLMRQNKYRIQGLVNEIWRYYRASIKGQCGLPFMWGSAVQSSSVVLGYI